MFKEILAIAAICVGTSAYSNSACDDLWFARNTIYDLHGYCFGSTLGKTVFNNEGCTTVDPELPTELEQRVQKLWSQADKMKCDPAQGRSKISVYNIESRKGMAHQPIASLTESACIGLKSNPIELYDAPMESSVKIGTVAVGDDVAWLHEDEDGWAFVTILKATDGSTPISGWSKKGTAPKCDTFAG